MTEQLLPLPVPALEDTIVQYLEALEPITDAVSFEATRRAAHAFAEGEGRILQESLLRYAAEIAPSSWLKDYSRERFLSLRTPLSIIGNFSMKLAQPSWLSKHSQAETATLLVCAAGRLYLDIVQDRLPPLQGCAVSLRREQLAQVLGAVRHPQDATDAYETFTPFREVHSFGVFCRNRYYLVRLFDEQGNLLTPAAVHKAVSSILAQNDPPSQSDFVAAGFAGSEKCAPFLSGLLLDKHNKACYDEMCRSVFHLTLDERQGNTSSFAFLFCPEAQNLWLYKPWSLAVFADSAIAVNNEHTAADGLSNVYLYEHLFRHMERLSRETWGGGEAAATKQIRFHFTEHQKAFLREVREEYRKEVEPFRTMEFRRTGIDWQWFRQRGISRDALIQCGFVYAQYRLYGCFRSTHESVSTAHFHQGRTSCLRSVTSAAAELAKAMNEADVLPETLVSMLQKSSESHSRNIRRAKQNVCFIRHGAGLMEMYRRHGRSLGILHVPFLFEEDNYRHFCSQELSTSTVGNSEAVEKFAFAPTAKDGLGLGYLAGDSWFGTSVTWNATQKGEGALFIEELYSYWDRLARLTRVFQANT